VRYTSLFAANGLLLEAARTQHSALVSLLAASPTTKVTSFSDRRKRHFAMPNCSRQDRPGKPVSGVLCFLKCHFGLPPKVWWLLRTWLHHLRAILPNSLTTRADFVLQLSAIWTGDNNLPTLRQVLPLSADNHCGNLD
jgi:hypothetical protein